MYLTTNEEPIDVTACPISLAPVARNAAMLSVVPAITSALLLNPKFKSSEFCRTFKVVPGVKIFGKAAVSIGRFEIQSGHFLFKQSYPNFNELLSSE